MIARQMQIVNKADFQAHGNASPWGCLACRFTRKTAGKSACKTADLPERPLDLLTQD